MSIFIAPEPEASAVKQGQGEEKGPREHRGPFRYQIGKCPGWVSIVIQRNSVKLSIPALPPKRP